MTQLATVEAECRSEEYSQDLSPEAQSELMARVDVISRRLSEPRPARWDGAGIDILSAWPVVPYTRLASMHAPGTSTFATAVVYERCPPADLPKCASAAHPKGVQLLVKRARAFGADAIVLHSDGVKTTASST